MLINYLKIAFRNLGKQKFYSGINIIGLTIGIATSTLITLYVLDELSYDQFHLDASQIYRVSLKGRLSGQDFTMAYTCSPMAAAVVQEFPEIKESIRFDRWDNIIATYEDLSYTEKKVIMADSNFFSFFSFKLIHGDPLTVLKGPNKIVLTETAARKYFAYQGAGDRSPIGKLMQNR